MASDADLDLPAFLWWNQEEHRLLLHFWSQRCNMTIWQMRPVNPAWGQPFTLENYIFRIISFILENYQNMVDRIEHKSLEKNHLHTSNEQNDLVNFSKIRESFARGMSTTFPRESRPIFNLPLVKHSTTLSWISCSS